MKTVLITGATSGIGEACAHLFAEKDNRIIITGRREDRLTQLKKTLETNYKVPVLAINFDVRNEKEVNDAMQQLPKEFSAIDVLINNAGLALGLSTIDEGNTDDWNTMIDTNIKGVLYMTKAVSAKMINQKSGHIINIGSTAGKETYKFGNVYCATKHAIEAITKGTRIDLLPYGIKVTSVCPGMAETEFSLVRFHGDKERAENVYKGFKALEAKDIANVIVYATEQPAHVCLNDIVITATAQANSFYTEKK